MIRFRCAACKQLLGVQEANAGQRITCPKCKEKVFAPESSAKDGSRPDVAGARPRVVPAKQRSANEEEVGEELDVIEEVDELEVIEDVKRPPRRKRRRKRADDSFPDPYRRDNSQHVPLLLLLCIPIPWLLLTVIGSFLLNPMCGMASLIWAAGWMWFNLIAAEDGAGTVLCVNFVPFYALYFGLGVAPK